MDIQTTALLLYKKYIEDINDRNILYRSVDRDYRQALTLEYITNALVRKEHIGLAPINEIKTLPITAVNNYFQLQYPILLSTASNGIMFTYNGKSVTYRIIDAFAAIVMLYVNGWIALAPLRMTQKEYFETELRILEESAIDANKQALVETTPFVDIDPIVDTLKPSSACRGDYGKSIPFLEKIAAQENLAHVCIFGDKHLGSQFYSITIIIMDRKLEDAIIPPSLESDVEQCNASIILVPIVIGITTVRVNFRGETVEAASEHANLLIIDKARKEYEHFEPHGEAGLGIREAPDIVNGVLISLKDNILRGYKYIPILDYCPTIGPQRAEEGQRGECDKGGFCVVWSTMYGHLRMLNPYKSRKAIINKLLQIATSPLYLRKYINYIDTISSTS